MAKRPKKSVEDKQLPRVQRAPGTPATPENTPAPAFDPAAKIVPGQGDPFDPAQVYSTPEDPSAPEGPPRAPRA